MTAEGHVGGNPAGGGVTGAAALNDLLDDYRVPPASRATILEAVTEVQADGVTVVGRSSSGGGYVSLSPPDGVIAAFVHPNRLSLALERRAGVRAVQQYEFCRVEKTDGAGTRVHLVMEQWAVQQHAVVVRRLIVAALRAAVPSPVPARPGRGRVPGRSSRPGGAGASAGGARAVRPPAGSKRPVPAKPAVCPVHFVELINGACDYCD